MEAILLIGLQASGKSTFYERRFAATHLRISMDLAATRAREQRLIESCLAGRRPFVIDNTNATLAQRATYIAAAESAAYRIIGFYFIPDVQASLARNSLRTGKAKIPVPGIYRTNKLLHPPPTRKASTNSTKSASRATTSKSQQASTRSSRREEAHFFFVHYFSLEQTIRDLYFV